MADFIDLKVQSGVGDYHLNRYRVVFVGPPGATNVTLAQDFVRGFKGYFDSSYATVEPQPRKFENDTTLRFHGLLTVKGHDLARPHHDWVVQGWKCPEGFTAQTLQRLFDDQDDAAATTASGAAASLPVIATAINEANAANHMHFLAGRRSWKLTTGKPFGLDDSCMVLETAAIERFSCRAYQVSNVGGLMENMIPPIWISNLTKFVSQPNFTVKPQDYLTRPPQAGGGAWEKGSVANGVAVDYLRINFPDLGALMHSTHCQDMLRIHPDLIDRSGKSLSAPARLWRSGVI